MNIVFFAAAYIVIAIAVAGYTFFQGMLARPKPLVFTMEDQVTLGLATLAVGAFWLLFLPTMLVSWAVQAYRYLTCGQHHWRRPFPRAIRVR